MSSYKIEIRNSPGWRKHSVATLGVSVTSPNWQGKKFASILDFAAAHFETIRIDVTDALYRHSFMAEYIPSTEALARANAMGALWLAQHQDMINECKVKPRIVRWSEWYNHPEYAKRLAKFVEASDANRVLREAVYWDVMDFYRRKQHEPSQIEYECGRNYLIEEMAVISLQAKELPGVRLYPGHELMCMSAVRSGAVPEAPVGLEHELFARMKFVTRDRKRIPASSEISVNAA